ncbi:MAG: hypothetical protein HY706_17460 [Candidatus Hydrogenedentes bacterium]|nr:hypothetical protein [Candidatus Hydrogenedentota bacterium]
MTERENWLRAVEFRCPLWIPCGVGFSPLTWHVHRERLVEVCLRHPLLFPEFQAQQVKFDEFGPVYRAGEYFRDNWGCLWYNSIGGLEGQVVEHPLARWDALEGYLPPDPKKLSERGDRDWAKIRERAAAAKQKGDRVSGDGERLFDRLYFLRGFENLMLDIATDDPHLPALIAMLTEYEMELIGLWLELGVDIMSFHTDIGTQRALMISPEKFRQYIKPMYMQLFQRCRKAGVHVYLSSDGNLLSIIDDLVECGVSAHDPQVRANSIEGIVRCYKGRLCANVDLDRQMFAFCSPEDVYRHVEEVVEAMFDPRGGLMVSGSVWDGNTPIENIEALCSAVEDFCLKGRRTVTSDGPSSHLLLAATERPIPTIR